VTTSKKRTNPWVIVLVCFGIVGLLIAGAIGGGIWWFSANKSAFIEKGKASDSEAREFSKDHDQDACVGEGLRRVDACNGANGGFVCVTAANLFTERCVVYAQPSTTSSNTGGAAICDEAPAKNEIMKTVEFAQSQCAKRSRQPNDQGCSQIMQSVARGCWRKKQSE
jgi:hypothetical protein